jgi:hypothetical protein
VCVCVCVCSRAGDVTVSMMIPSQLRACARARTSERNARYSLLVRLAVRQPLVEPPVWEQPAQRRATDKGMGGHVNTCFCGRRPPPVIHRPITFSEFLEPDAHQIKRSCHCKENWGQCAAGACRGTAVERRVCATDTLAVVRAEGAQTHAHKHTHPLFLHTVATPRGLGSAL